MLFETSNEICATLSVVDNDFLEGNRSYQLILEDDGPSTVPVLLYPNTIPITVIDNANDRIGKCNIGAVIVRNLNQIML